MDIRVMQIFVPEEARDNIEKVLGDHRNRPDTWRDFNADKQRVMHLLVPAEEVESIMDGFESSRADIHGLSAVVFAVEAVWPPPQLPDSVTSAAEDSQEQAKDSKKPPDRLSRQELYNDVVQGLGVDRVFMAMTVLSSIVAAVGLLRNDVAVLIGAMVIAPLLGPNVAMSLSTTLGDLNLFRRSLLTIVVGIALTLAVSFIVGVVASINTEVPAIASRTHVSIGQLVLALAAGSAGTFALTRGLAGAVIGVMVAVALMPPLVTAGMLFSTGYLRAASGATLLFAANLICINLAGVVTFLAQGIRPCAWW
jgi:uncharacterized hydrophobic protein (TIGR00341 family)